MIRALLCVLTCLVSWSVQGASACRVLDPELVGRYSGGCNADGLAEGKGIAQGQAEYVGEFKSGRKHGYGVKSWPWGDRYVGSFVEDAKEGEGIYIWGPKAANAGDSYTGQYLCDRRHGRGVYQWASGERYEGTWDSDRMTGPATPMAIQRGRYQQALREAVVKAGVVVCRNVSIGIGNQSRIRGTVIEADTTQMMINVRLDQALPVLIGDKPIAAGEVFRDSAIAWEPCH